MIFLLVFGVISCFQMLATSMSAMPQSRLQPGVLNISLRVTNGRKTHMKKWKCLSLFIKPGTGESRWSEKWNSWDIVTPRSGQTSRSHRAESHRWVARKRSWWPESLHGKVERCPASASNLLVKMTKVISISSLRHCYHWSLSPLSQLSQCCQGSLSDLDGFSANDELPRPLQDGLVGKKKQKQMTNTWRSDMQLPCQHWCYSVLQGSIIKYSLPRVLRSASVA